MRGLKRDGFVRRNPKGGAWFLASDELERLPDLPLVEWLAERELGRLPPDLVAHAQLAALLGSEFSEMEIEAVLTELDRDGLGADFPMDPRVATRKLIGMGLLILHRRDIIGFRHAMVREAVRGATSEALRGQVHNAAFRFYRGAGEVMSDSERLPRLAFHAAKAGLRDEASALYLQLAERARSRHAYLEAESLYSQALQLLPEADDRRRMTAWRGRGLMRYRVSRYDAIDDLALAREAARRIGDFQSEVEIVLDESTAFDWTDEYRKSRALVTDAETLAAALASAPGAEHSARLIAARVLLGQGRAMWRFSERKEALEKLTQAVELAEQLGDDGYETLVVSLLLLGDLLPWYGETKRAELAFERVIALCEDHGDRVHVAVALLNRRQIWIAHRDLGARDRGHARVHPDRARAGPGDDDVHGVVQPGRDVLPGGRPGGGLAARQPGRRAREPALQRGGAAGRASAADAAPGVRGQPRPRALVGAGDPQPPGAPGGDRHHRRPADAVRGRAPDHGRSLHARRRATRSGPTCARAPRSSPSSRSRSRWRTSRRAGWRGAAASSRRARNSKRRTAWRRRSPT